MKRMFRQPRRLKKMAGCLAALGLLLAPAAQAAEETQQTQATALQQAQIAIPWRAVISPHGGRIEARQTVAVNEAQGVRSISFTIPGDADNLNISIPGQTILRWSTAPVLRKGSSDALTYRNRILQEKDSTAAQLETVKARIAVWKEQTAAADAQNLERRQQLMQQELPELLKRQATLATELAKLQRELAQMPDFRALSKLVTVSLAGENAKPGNLEISYSYNLANCGWEAVYDFDASIKEPESTGVNVRLLADVWQNTGIDWKGTEIILASMSMGQREPQPLQRWVVGEDAARPAPQPRVYNLAAKRAAPAAAGIATMEDAVEVEAMAPVAADASGVYAAWTLSARGLPDGRSRIQILEDVWKTSLEWLARPTTEDNRVWLLAKYKLPAGQAWPAGAAEYSLNGQNVGSGSFAPDGREATLYFGADPRVTVATTIDASQQGETGFISTSKTWTGAWTYTLNNGHDSEIRVKVERPAPMLANEQINVTYKDNPPATLNEKEHMLSWEVAVPAHGKSVIEHKIVLSSPEKLPLFPTVR